MLTAFLKLTLYFRIASLIFYPVCLTSCEITYKVRNYNYRCMSSIILNYIIFSEMRNNLQDMKPRPTLNSVFTEMTKCFVKKLGDTSVLFHCDLIHADVASSVFISAILLSRVWTSDFCISPQGCLKPFEKLLLTFMDFRVNPYGSG